MLASRPTTRPVDCFQAGSGAKVRGLNSGTLGPGGADGRPWDGSEWVGRPVVGLLMGVWTGGPTTSQAVQQWTKFKGVWVATDAGKEWILTAQGCGEYAPTGRRTYGTSGFLGANNRISRLHAKNG
jgi:hypothetical protein